MALRDPLELSRYISSAMNTLKNKDFIIIFHSSVTPVQRIADEF